MYYPDFYQEFTPYLDPKTWCDKDGNMQDWKNRSLVIDAPQSAIDAFIEFKKLELEAEKKGIIL
jgi:hypothetical protein